MTVLVTGGRGLLGRGVVSSLLRAGEQVHVTTRGPASRDDESAAQWHDADLLDKRARRALLKRVRPRAVVHLAWETTHGRFWQSPLNEVWESATVDLVRVARDCGASRVVVAGTCAEYDWTRLEDAGGLCNESTTPLHPATKYGAAKLRTLERLTALPEAGTWLAWGRVFSPFGPGEDAGRLLPSIVTALLDGRPAVVASPDLVRDYLHADEVAQAFVALLASDVCGAVNVASGAGVPLGHLAGEVARLVGRPGLLRLGGAPPLPGEPLRLVADVVRLHEEVGFRPRTTLADGLRQIVDWWRGQRR